MMNFENYTNKPITDFTENDTLYYSKIISGYLITFLLKFKSFEKNNVIGEIIEIQPNNMSCIWDKSNLHKIGDEIKGSISKCYTYKKGKGCHWFKKIDKTYKCI